MTNLDKHEQRIHDAFSQIDVDTEGFKNRLNFSTTASIKKPVKFPAVAAAILILVVISVTTYAAMGGLDRFRYEFDPAFINLATPPSGSTYAESQGIRIEILGAERIHNFTLLYASVQDISGRDRLNRHTIPVFERGEGGTSANLLHFDRATNTGYFEIFLSDRNKLEWDDALTISISSIGHPGSSASNYQWQTVIGGSWHMEVIIAESDHPSLSLTDISIPEMHVDHLVIHSFGIEMEGTHETEPEYFELRILIEIDSRPIQMASGGGGIGENTFDFTWNPASPIDVESVTAIIINGYRVEIPQ